MGKAESMSLMSEIKFHSKQSFYLQFTKSLSTIAVLVALIAQGATLAANGFPAGHSRRTRLSCVINVFAATAFSVQAKETRELLLIDSQDHGTTTWEKWKNSPTHGEKVPGGYVQLRKGFDQMGYGGRPWGQTMHVMQKKTLCQIFIRTHHRNIRVAEHDYQLRAVKVSLEVYGNFLLFFLIDSSCRQFGDIDKSTDIFVPISIYYHPSNLAKGLWIMIMASAVIQNWMPSKNITKK